MLIPKIEITFYQTPVEHSIEIPFEVRPIRDNIIRMNFCNHFEMNDSVDTLINTGTIILPKNKLYVNISKQLTTYSENTIDLEEELKLTNIGVTNDEGELAYNLITDYNPDSDFSSKEPIFRVGDLLVVICSYYDPNTNKPYSKVKYRKYIRSFVITNLKMEDTLEISIASLSWYFKQISLQNGESGKATNLVPIIQQLIYDTTDTFPYQLIDENSQMRIDFLKPDNVSFNDKILISANQTFAQLLDMLKKDYRLNAYMINNLLVFPKLIQLPDYISNAYLSAEMKNFATKLNIKYPKIFCFDNNIITSELEYKSKTTINLSAIVSNTFLAKTGEVTKDGYSKSKRKKLSVYIEYTQENDQILQDADFFTKKLTTKKLKDTIKNLKGIKILSDYDQQGNKIANYSMPAISQNDTDGERRTFTFYEARTIEDLIVLGLQELQKFFYEGYRGSFTTFGEPTVLLTDTITIIDKDKPERCGYYRVKEVTTSFGMDGYRQEISLDMRIPGIIPITSIKKI